MNEYRVNLDIYNGPMDLLLYLIRREEVDIYDIPIVNITEQYISHVETLETLDPNLAGEFLIMAGTLMEIKTRMLLPSAPIDEQTDDESGLDPRTELVRQLLEYKAFKDAAGDLSEAKETQSQKFHRPNIPLTNQPELPEIDLEDVQVWDLFDAFSQMMTAIGKNIDHTEIIYDDTPIALHATDILDRLKRDGTMTFRTIFEGRTKKSEIVGLFLAILELVRKNQIIAMQSTNFGQIDVRLNPNAPDEEAVFSEQEEISNINENDAEATSESE